MATVVGAITARLGFDVDDDGAQRFERRLRTIRGDVQKPVTAELKGDYDPKALQAYDRKLTELRAQAQRKQDFKAQLGADYNPQAFRAYEKDLDRTSRGHDTLRRSSDDTVKAQGRLRTSFGSIWRSGGAGLAAAGGIYGLAQGIKSVVSASGEAEVSQQRLEAQLKAAGVSYQRHAGEIERVIEKTSQLAGLDDEDLADAFTNIVRVTGDVDKSLRLVGVAADFARAKNLDVAKAGELVGKVAGGNTGILSRYGITLKDGATATEALGELQKRFAGQAEAYGQTQKGAGDRVQVAWENVQERLGRGLAPVLTRVGNGLADLFAQAEKGKGVLGALGRAGQGAGRIFQAVAGFVRRLSGAFSGGNRDATAFAGKVGRLFGAIKDFAVDVARRVKAVFSGEGGIGADLRRLGRGFANVANFIIDTFGPVIERMLPGLALAIEGIAKIIRGVVRIVGGILTGDWQQAWDGAKDVVVGAAEAIAGVAKGIFGGLTGVFRRVLDNIAGAASSLLGVIGDVLDAASKLPGVGGKFKDAAEGVRTAQKSIDKWREGLRDAGKQADRFDLGAVRKENRKTADSFRDLRKDANADVSDIKKHTEKRAKEIAETLGRESREGKEALANNFRAAQDAVRRQMRRGEIATRDGMKAIRGYVADELEVYGLSLRQAKNIAKGDGSGGRYGDPDNNRGREGGALRQRGGRLQQGGWIGGIRGVVGGDTIQIAPGTWAAPGEYMANGPGDSGAVINRHQAPIVDLALMRGGHTLDTLPRDQTALPMIEAALADWGGLDALFATVDRPHMLQRGGIVPVPGFPGERAASSILDEIRWVAKTFGLTLTDAFGPGHESPGHTIYGTAADFAGPDRAMDAAVRALVGKGYLVGYDGRYGSADWPGHGPAAGQGGSNAHLHVEFGGKTGTMGALAPRIPRQRIHGGGPAGQVAQGALDVSRAGAQRLLDDAAAASLTIPAPGGGTGGAPTMGRGALMAVIARALRWTGRYSPANAAALYRRVMQESGGNPAAQNNWDINAQRGDPSVGLAQVINATFQAYRDKRLPNDRTHPLANLVAAIRYMIGRYGRIVDANGQGYQRGGRSPLGPLGRLGRLGRFLAAGGRTGTARPGGQGLAGSRATSPYSIGRLKRRGRDRIGNFEGAIGQVEQLGRDYEFHDRRYGQSEEELIDPDTGAVNTRAIQKRAAELLDLAIIRQQIVDKLTLAVQAARKVVATYKTIVGRLRRSLKHADKRKERKGIRAQIREYRGRIGEWEGTYADVVDQRRFARLDLKDVMLERKEVLGTRAEPAEPEEPYDESTESGESGSGSDTSAPAEPAGPAEPSPDQQALLDQANQRLEALKLDMAGLTGQLAAFRGPGDLGTARGQTAYGSAAADATLTTGVGMGGYQTRAGAGTAGGATINLHPQVLVPGSTETLHAIAGAVVSALDAQTTRQTTVQKVG